MMRNGRAWLKSLWRPNVPWSWAGLAFAISWSVLMVFWVRAGWGVWLLAAIGGALVCLNGIVHPKNQESSEGI